MSTSGMHRRPFEGRHLVRIFIDDPFKIKILVQCRVYCTLGAKGLNKIFSSAVLASVAKLCAVIMSAISD